MAASIEQKVDYLLKKIGYTASKTGIAEDSSLSGTKKAPFAEALPSPLVVPVTSVYGQSGQIPATPPGTTSGVVQVYGTATAFQMTEDNTVSGKRSWLARAVQGDNTSAMVGDWIDTQFGSDYIINVYAGDPNSGGTKLSAAGSGSNDTWFFDYSSGVLNFNGDAAPSAVTGGADIYLVGYRYTGSKGLNGTAGSFSSITASSYYLQDGSNPEQLALSVSGTDVTLNGIDAIDATTKATLEATLAIAPNEFNDIVVSGLSTFNGTVDLNADIIGSGDITYTGIGSITAGIATFGQLTAGAGSTMTGKNFIETLSIADGLEVSGVTTFKGDVSFEGTSISGTIDQAARAFRLDAPEVAVDQNTTFALPLVANPGLDTSFVSTNEVTYNPATGILTAPSANFSENVQIVGVLTAGILKVDNPLEEVVITDVLITGIATVNGQFDANGDVNLGDSALDTVSILGRVDTNVIPSSNSNLVLGADGAGRWARVYAGVGDFSNAGIGLTVADGAFFGGDVTIEGTLNATAENANKVLVTPELSSATQHFINFSEQSTDPTDLHRDSTLTYTPSTNTLAATNVSATTLTASGEVEGGSLDINGAADISGNLDVGGDLTVAGTLNYEDVTDIDSVGLITARQGIIVTNNGIDVQSGIVTSADGFQGNLVGDVGGNVIGNLTGEVNAIAFDTNADGTVTTGIATATGFSGPLVGDVTGNVTGDLTGEVNAAAFDTNESGIVVTGVATATLFSGDGSELTNLNAGIAGLDINPRHVLVGGALTVTGDSTFNGDIAGDGATNLTGINNITAGGSTQLGTLAVTGGSTLTGQVTAININSVGVVTSTAFAVGATKVLQTVNGQVALTGIATLDATTKATIEREIALAPNDFSSLNITGLSTFNGLVDINDGVDVTGQATFNDGVYFVGVSTFDDTASFDGVVDFNATTNVNNNASLNISNVATFDALTESPAATFLVKPDFNEGLTVASGKEATINGDLNVDGHTELDNVNIAGVATFSADVNTLAHLTANTFRATGVSTFVDAVQIDGNLTANGDIIGDGSTDISGIASVTATEYYGDGSKLTGLDAGLDGLNVTLGDVTVGGALTVTGATDINGDIDIDGHAEVDELRVSGVSTFVAGATFQENVAILGQGSIQTLVVAGNSSLQDTQVGGALTVTGATDLNGNLDVAGDLGVGGTANFSDLVSFQDNVNANASLSVADDLSVSNIFSVVSTGELQEFAVTGVTGEFNDGIRVDGTVSGNAGILTTGDLAGTISGLDIAPRHVNASGVGTFAQGLRVDAGGATIVGDTQLQGIGTLNELNVLGNATIGTNDTNTVTVNADVASNLIPDGDGTRDLGANGTAWANIYADNVETTELEVANNVVIGGNLSVGGTITSAELVELDIIAPVIELGLESVGDGTLQPPSTQTSYSSGTVMWYNRVGVSSDNAQAAAMFADVKPTGTYRIGFATDVTVGDGDTLGAVNGWAEIEAGGLWMNDCAGESVVINCVGSERFLNNITVDGGTF